MMPFSWSLPPLPSFLPCFSKHEPKDISTKLMEAVKRGSESAVEALLTDNPIEVNNLIGGESLLSAAVKNGSIPIIGLLMQHGAQLNIPNAIESHQHSSELGLTPLDFALLSPDREKILAALFAEATKQSQEKIGSILNDTAMMQLANKSVMTIEKTSPSPNICCDNVDALNHILNTLPLVDISSKEQVQAFFLQMKLDTPIDSNGNTYLHYLIHFRPYQESQSVVVLAAKHGVNLHFKNKFGHTPLHIACANQDIKAIQLLTAHQADLFQVDNENIPAIALMAAAANPNDPLKLELSALTMAAFTVASILTAYAVDTEEYKIAGMTVSEMLMLGHILSPILSTVPNALGFIDPNSAFNSKKSDNRALFTSLFIAGLAFCSYLDRENESMPMWFIFKLISEISNVVALKTALQGLKLAWKHKKLRPVKAWFNFSVHFINFSSSAYKTADRLNQIATGFWHVSLRFHKFYLHGRMNCLHLYRNQNLTVSQKEAYWDQWSEIFRSIKHNNRLYSQNFLSYMWRGIDEPKSVLEAKKFLYVDESQYKIDPNLAVDNAYSRFLSQWGTPRRWDVTCPFSEPCRITIEKKYASIFSEEKCLSLFSKNQCLSAFSQAKKARDVLSDHLKESIFP